MFFPISRLLPQSASVQCASALRPTTSSPSKSDRATKNLQRLVPSKTDSGIALDVTDIKRSKQTLRGRQRQSMDSLAENHMLFLFLPFSFKVNGGPTSFPIYFGDKTKLSASSWGAANSMIMPTNLHVNPFPGILRSETESHCHIRSTSCVELHTHSIA